MDEVMGLVPLVAVLIGVVVPRPWGTNVAFLLASVSTFVLCLYFWNEGATDDRGLLEWKPLMVTAFGLVVMGVFRPQPWRDDRRRAVPPGPYGAPAAGPPPPRPFQEPPTPPAWPGDGPRRR